MGEYYVPKRLQRFVRNASVKYTIAMGKKFLIVQKHVYDGYGFDDKNLVHREIYRVRPDESYKKRIIDFVTYQPIKDEHAEASIIFNYAKRKHYEQKTI